MLYFVDVGTHIGQEYRALKQMGQFEYWQAYLRHRIRVYRKGGEQLPRASFEKMLHDNQRIRCAGGNVRCVLVEPNRTLFSTAPVFRQAEYAFNIALSANAKSFSFMPLFFAKGDRRGQSSSIFKEKPNVDTNDFEFVANVEAMHFAKELQRVFEQETDEPYRVVLRINNEGAEVEVIKSFRVVFGTRLVAVMGSLMDVAKVKGDDALAAIHGYMEDEGVEFIEFHSDIRTWPDAFAFLAAKV